MNAIRFAMPGTILVCVIVWCVSAASDETPSANSDKSPIPKSIRAAQVDEKDRVSIDVARDRAKTMYDVYSSTLDMMHHRYFHGQRAVVPARALQDVFADMKRQSKMEARWISVNSNAMSIDHEPQTDFEKQAAKEISSGKTEFEMVEGGYYRRAGAIPLTGGCIGCHEGLFHAASTTPKFAALVISVPVKSDSDTSK